jgi:hypothetical protein
LGHADVVAGPLTDHADDLKAKALSEDAVQRRVRGHQSLLRYVFDKTDENVSLEWMMEDLLGSVQRSHGGNMWVLLAFD